ncbi:MAG: type II toxin-antitoxin system VapC family toxin [Truepera sp.]|nr:type II toxin-antitoxin system VapC family toxin [Truepera sp.]
MPEARALLLDTHVWVWLVEGAGHEFSPAALAELRQKSLEGKLLVSHISVWEVAMLTARGRLELTVDLDTWVQQALQAPGVRSSTLSPDILISSTRLPGHPHGDPADRILMATSRLTGAALATRDQTILAYAQRGHLAVLDVTP